MGGTATAAVLLALAYALYRWGTASAAAAAARQYNDRQYNDGRTAAAAEPGGAVFGGKLEQQADEGDESAEGEGFYEPGYEPGSSGVGFEGSSVPGVGVEAGFVEAEESEVQEAEKVISWMVLSPYSGCLFLWLEARLAIAVGKQQQRQQ
jgi:hypothetical protein